MNVLRYLEDCGSRSKIFIKHQPDQAISVKLCKILAALRGQLMRWGGGNSVNRNQTKRIITPKQLQKNLLLN